MKSKAYIVRDGIAADALNRHLPEGKTAYSVMGGATGARFDSIDILFEPEGIEIVAIQDAWLCRLKPGNANHDFIDDFLRKYPYQVAECP